jgi:transposase
MTVDTIRHGIQYIHMTQRELELEQVVKTLMEENQRLHQRIEQLERELAKTRKNSTTSSKPPSSDIVKPPKPSQPAGTTVSRKAGGQPGHPKHQRPAFPPEQLDQIHVYTLDACPWCGTALESAEKAPRVIQQIDLVERPVRIAEHRGVALWCPSCRAVHYAPFPPQVERGGLFGAQVTALVAYLKGVCHASFSTIRTFFRDVLGCPVSRGHLRNVIATVSDALEPACDELLHALPDQTALHIDETGHQDTGERFWTWCFKATMYTLFHLDKSRSSQVLLDVLGEEFQGVIGCDYFSAYRKYMRLNDHVKVQFCLAHLIREVKYLTTLGDAETRAYAERLRGGLKALFDVIHRRDELDSSRFQQALEESRETLLCDATQRVPQTNEAQNLAKRFEQHGQQYFQFLTTPDIEPTNNLAEQAIRFVVIDRHITQGTRSQSGRHWCERIWTVIATCTQRGMDIFEFLYQSICAYWEQRSHPSLLPDSG